MKDISMIIALVGLLTAAINLLRAAIEFVTRVHKERSRKKK